MRDFDFKLLGEKGRKEEEEGRGECGKRYRMIHATEHLPQHPRRICEKHHPDKNAQLLARQPVRGTTTGTRAYISHYRIFRSDYKTIDVNSEFSLRCAKCFPEKHRLLCYTLPISFHASTALPHVRQRYGRRKKKVISVSKINISEVRVESDSLPNEFYK